MGEFLLLLLAFFVIIPMAKAAIAVFKARREARRFFDRFKQRTQSENGGAYEAGTSKPATKRKKINAEDGEFVAFEDISNPSPAEPSATEHKVVVEQQIVDVEWEDIK